MILIRTLLYNTIIPVRFDSMGRSVFRDPRRRIPVREQDADIERVPDISKIQSYKNE